jgi:DNA ligase-1
MYELRNVGGVFSCSCPAWRNQGRAPHQRTCKHLIALRGQQPENDRLRDAGVDGPAARASSTPSTAPAKKDTAPPVLLAHPWDQVVDLSGWWMSEKLDGVRAYWDGKQMLSRLGNTFVVPPWFVEGLPDYPLDGELWGGRKMFQRTVSIVRRQDASDDWRHIQYVVFDAPALGFAFEERLEHCHQKLTLSDRLAVLEHQRCDGVDHLRQELARVETMGGEGLMLRQPRSLYESGRSWSLLKVKSFHDAEAIVIGHQPGAGRHKGRLGALLAELPDGTQFSVGTGLSDAERECPPPIGSLITFRYQELSDAGVPRFPSYLGVRFDLPTPARKPATRPQTLSKPKETNMHVIQTALAEACDLNSQSAQARLEQLLTALHSYASGSPDALRSYGEKYPFSRVNEALASEAPSAPSAAAPTAAKPVSKPKAAPALTAPTVPAEGARHFEFVEGGSSKFWEVSLAGNEQTVRYGRIGTLGQSKTKSFASPEAAQRDTDKLIAEKTGKGYQET